MLGLLGVTTLQGVNLGSFLRPQAFCPVWLIKYKNTSGLWSLFGNNKTINLITRNERNKAMFLFNAWHFESRTTVRRFSSMMWIIQMSCPRRLFTAVSFQTRMSFLGATLSNIHIPSIGGIKKQISKVWEALYISREFSSHSYSRPTNWWARKFPGPNIQS